MNSVNERKRTNPINSCIPTSVPDAILSTFPDVDHNNNNSVENVGLQLQCQSGVCALPVEVSNLIAASYPPPDTRYLQKPAHNELYNPSPYSFGQPSTSAGMCHLSPVQHYVSAPTLYPLCPYDMTGFIPAMDMSILPYQPQPPSTSKSKDLLEDKDFACTVDIEDENVALDVLHKVNSGDQIDIHLQEINLNSSKKEAAPVGSEPNKKAKQTRTEAQKEANRKRERDRMQSVKNVLNDLKALVGFRNKKKSKIAVIEEAYDLIKVLERKAEEKKRKQKAIEPPQMENEPDD